MDERKGQKRAKQKRKFSYRFTGDHKFKRAKAAATYIRYGSTNSNVRGEVKDPQGRSRRSKEVQVIIAKNFFRDIFPPFVAESSQNNWTYRLCLLAGVVVGFQGTFRDPLAWLRKRIAQSNSNGYFIWKCWFGYIETYRRLYGKLPWSTLGRGYVRNDDDYFLLLEEFEKRSKHSEYEEDQDYEGESPRVANN